MTERNFHQVRREIRLMQQIRHEGAVELRGTFEDGGAIYLVQEICAKVGGVRVCMWVCVQSGHVGRWAGGQVGRCSGGRGCWWGLRLSRALGAQQVT